MAIGGASCTGKSTLARTLASRLGLVPVDTDPFWLALQRAVPREVDPELHAFFDPETWYRPTEELVELYLRVAGRVCHALEAVVAHYDRVRIKAVIEGTWLLPAFTQKMDYGLPPDLHRMSAPVRSLFLAEPSEAELDKRLHERGDGYGALPLPVRSTLCRMHYLYGLELKHRAEDRGIPVVESRPFDTLLDRALIALGVDPKS